MATPVMTLDALAILQVDELRNLIKSLQGLAASMTEGSQTPATPRRPPTPTAVAGEEEAILWEKVGTGHVPLGVGPPTRPPPANEQTLEDRTLNNLLKPDSTSADICSKQQRKTP